MGLEIIQKQLLKLNMTPQMLQSVTVLQLNQEQLADFIRRKALENPLPRLRENDLIHPSGTGGEARSMTEVIEETIAGTDNFREQLHRDLHQELRPSSIRDGADFLIDSLDENGYLDGEPAEILSGLGLDGAQAEEALRSVQMLDPAGIGARSAVECLLLQLRRLDPAHLLAEQILVDYADFFMTQDWGRLAGLIGRSEAEISREVAVIRGLNPLPAAGLQDAHTEYVVPDITVQQTAAGLRCTVTDRYLPSVSLDIQSFNSYLQTADSETRRYLLEKKEEADGLISGIGRRKQTLLRLAALIIHRQEKFLLTGRTDQLQPLTMKQAAGALGLHESTVSRAAANKYAETAHGILPLKKFFVRPFSGSEQDTSIYRIQQKIKKMIEAEDNILPLSDQQITDQLSREGLHCARRTVAKYRNLLGIPAARQRKKMAKSESINDF